MLISHLAPRKMISSSSSRRVVRERRLNSSSDRQNSASLIKILEDGVRVHSLTKSDALCAYTGFGNFSALLAGGGFLPMNGNRAVNRSVVASRVADNLQRLKEHRPLADFGQIMLVVVEEGPPDWLVLDGQHRLEAMRELHASHGIDVHFQFRAKVVQNESEAHEALMLYQDQHPPDPRTFFPDRRQTNLAEQVLARLRNEFPVQELWPASVQSSPTQRRPGLRTGDVNRPFLTDNIVLGILGSSGLLDDDDSTFDSVMRHLLAANDVLKGRRELGPNATSRMRERAATWGCFLGFFRETKLEYVDIRSEIDDLLAAREATASPQALRPTVSDDDECHVCIDAPRTHLFLPCGHRSVCESCSRSIVRGSNPICPICRGKITGTLRVYG